MPSSTTSSLTAHPAPTAATLADNNTAHAHAPLMSVVDMVWPDQSNHHGTLFGGAALSILDRMAFIGASKVLRGSVVTASVGHMTFAARPRRPFGGMPSDGNAARHALCQLAIAVVG